MNSARTVLYILIPILLTIGTYQFLKYQAPKEYNLEGVLISLSPILDPAFKATTGKMDECLRHNKECLRSIMIALCVLFVIPVILSKGRHWPSLILMAALLVGTGAHYYDEVWRYRFEQRVMMLMVGALVLSFLFAICHYRKREIKLEPVRTKLWMTVLLLVILFAGGIFRFYRLDQRPAGFNADMACDSKIFTITLEKNLSYFRFFTAPRSWYTWDGGVFGLVSHIFYRVFHPGVLTIRYASVFYGLLLVVAGFFLMKKFFNLPFAFIAAVMLTAFPWLLALSRFGTPHLIPSIQALVMMYFLLSALEDNRWYHWMALGLVQGLALYMHLNTIPGFATLGLVLMPKFFFPSFWKRSGLKLLLCIVAAAVIGAPFLLNIKKHNYTAITGRTMFTKTHQTDRERAPFTERLKANYAVYKENFDGAIDQFYGHRWVSYPWHGGEQYFSRLYDFPAFDKFQAAMWFVGMGIGLYLLRFRLWRVVWLYGLCCFIPNVLSRPYTHRLIPFAPVFVFFLALPVYYFWKSWQIPKSRWIGAIGTIVVTALLAGYMWVGAARYITSRQDDMGPSWIESVVATRLLDGYDIYCGFDGSSYELTYILGHPKWFGGESRYCLHFFGRRNVDEVLWDSIHQDRPYAILALSYKREIMDAIERFYPFNNPQYVECERGSRLWMWLFEKPPEDAILKYRRYLRCQRSCH